MKIITFSLFPLLLRFSYETECCESFFSLLLRFSYESIILISNKDIARIVKPSIVKTIKLQAALPKRTSGIFSGNFQSKFSFKMF